MLSFPDFWRQTDALDAEGLHRIAPPRLVNGDRDPEGLTLVKPARDAARPLTPAVHVVVDNSAHTLACELDDAAQLSKGRRCTETSVG